MNPLPHNSNANCTTNNSTMDQSSQNPAVNHAPNSSTVNQLPQTSAGSQASQIPKASEGPQNDVGGMDISSTSSAELELNKIETFVFFDLETSGLSGMDCRILELTMVAVSRSDLLNMKSTPRNIVIGNTSENGGELPKISPIPKLPRVLHKYTKLYYPRKIIRPDIEEITGLNNELLHRLPGFSSSSAEALNLFLDLPKPVALVAHNGKRFDYPLLKAELENVIDGICDMTGFRNLRCADSLLAFRKIEDEMKIESEIQEITEITSLAASFSFDDMDDMDDDEIMGLEPERKKKRCEENGHEEGSRRVSTPPSPGDGGQLEISVELPVTPMKDQCIVTNTPLTPVKAKIPPKLPITPETSTQSSKVNGMSSVRRSLTYRKEKRKWDGTQPFKQVNLYKRLFGSHYDAHRAESDCIALLEICGFYSERFVNWADVNSFEFTTVKPMWTKRRTFRIMGGAT